MGDKGNLGSSDFVEAVLKQANEQFEKRTLAIAEGMDLDELINSAADQLDIDPTLHKSFSRRRAAARARSIVCCLAADRLKIGGAKVGRNMGLSPYYFNYSNLSSFTSSLILFITCDRILI